jgi:hypothetical protein
MSKKNACLFELCLLVIISNKMSIPKINGPRIPDRDPDINASSAASASEAVFEVKKKRIKVKREKIAGVAKGLAEIAFSMGQTNDVDTFTEQMTDDILAAFQLVAKRQRESKKHS